MLHYTAPGGGPVCGYVGLAEWSGRWNVKLWMTTVASARGATRTAQEIEAAGWDGMLVVDSQNLSGDPYVALALAATATTRLGLGTGVTELVTPVPRPSLVVAVAASARAT